MGYDVVERLTDNKRAREREIFKEKIASDNICQIVVVTFERKKLTDMINAEISLYPKGGKAVVRQMDLTEDGFVELQKLGEEERKAMVCGLLKFDATNIERVEVKMGKEEYDE